MKLRSVTSAGASGYKRGPVGFFCWNCDTYLEMFSGYQWT